MKLGIAIGYSGARMALPIERILLAERLGFDSVWTAESYGSDAVTPLAYIAALTKRIRLGTGVAQLAARTPANLAMSAQTIDAMAGGNRMIVGLGVSGPQIVEGWYGQPWGKPNARLRDYIAITRAIWERKEPVSHDGPEIAVPYTGPGATGLGKPLKSILHGNPNIPIMIGTMNTANIALAAEVADGWLALRLSPDRLRQRLSLIRDVIARRTDGKRFDSFEVCAVLPVQLATDVKAALATLKPAIALYVGGMGAKGKNFHKDAMVEGGFGAAAERIQELFLADRKEEAAAAVPDEYVDLEAVVGPPERIKQRWTIWRDAGLNHALITSPTDEVVELMARIGRD